MVVFHSAIEGSIPGNSLKFISFSTLLLNYIHFVSKITHQFELKTRDLLYLRKSVHKWTTCNKSQPNVITLPLSAVTQNRFQKNIQCIANYHVKCGALVTGIFGFKKLTGWGLSSGKANRGCCEAVIDVMTNLSFFFIKISCFSV